MATTTEEYRQNLKSNRVASGLQDERIVVSGMSGLFPKSGSVKEFSDILYKKINPVTSGGGRWTAKHHEASDYIGKVPDIDRFDSQFFMVHHRLGNAMDPMGRKVLEQSYQAIYDAGLSPKHLSGKKVGVYIGAGFSDMENRGVFDCKDKTGYAITGCSKTMYANRISYWLNAKGPSVTVDDACCASMVALEQALSAINRGVCEAALVGGTNLCLVPHVQVHYNRCIKISPDGITRSFDENANGCVKSEAISVLFLQKAKNALRAYAEIVHVKNEFISKLSGETGQVFGFVRNPDSTAAFMKQFYLEAGVSPQEVEYIEACGSATPEADKAELKAIEKVFCENRTDPLLVGSVISNVGLTDAASGVTAVTKVLLGYHRGLIAANLHCNTPRQDIQAIRDGRLRVVTKHQPFRGSYAAVNCLSVTGVNSHLLLRRYPKTKDLSRYTSSIPRLVTVSARQKVHLQDVFEDLKLRPIDAEELALLHNIHSNNISGHLGRGYIILDTNEEQDTISLSEKMEHSDESHRPLWFVYSGMGSQWAGMGAQLMRIPIFGAAIERCRNVLEPKGIDIVDIITSQDKSIFDNVLNSFVGIAAVQIGLTDILTALGLFPDNLIGHSVGELGCAYADGCLTAEEMILSAYSRGKASNDSPLIRGAMAAVGLGYQQLSKLCPPEIAIACHNSSNSSTISGPEQNIREFVARLTADGVFTKVVPSGNIAYHSRYIADAGDNLLRLLSEIIHEPKARSERWLSTSVPQQSWNEPVAAYCSPEYLTNNLVSPVYFEETSALIPSNAVLIEIAPHGLLQAILKRSLPESCKNIPLTRRGHSDSAVFLLDAVGKLYIEGYSPQVSAIYPKVEFPVSSKTPHLAHFVKWNHTDSWVLSENREKKVKTAFSCKFLITTHDDCYNYLKGNVVQGNILYPFAAALEAVWDTLCMAIGSSKKTISVRFYDVLLYSQPILHDQKQLKLDVSLQRGNGRFEVFDGCSKVATGYIIVFDKKSDKTKNIDFSGEFPVSSDELYQHLIGLGYSYREQFRSIHSADESLTMAQILWNDNWATLIDGLFQFNALQYSHEGVSQPTEIRDLTINVEKHLESIQQLDGITVIKAEVNKVFNSTRCGGILLQNLNFRTIPSSNKVTFKLKYPTLPGNNTNMPERSLSSESIISGLRVTLNTGCVGNLESLHWEEAPTLSESGVKVMVEYAGINMSDVKRATGAIRYGNNEKYHGMDFSGVTERGERVMGLVRNGAASTVVLAQPELLWPVPAHWSLEEAATVPLAYVQAFYYLCVINKLQHGWNVLIHGGAGALGQAAISVALAHGCQVFTTVADNAKKRFLLKLFPQLNENAIGNSRDVTFGDMVLNATNGEGCKVIISCVREDLKNVCLNCTAFSGTTIDIVQIQNRDVFDYGMSFMTKSRSYIAANLNSIFNKENRAQLRKLQTLLSDGIALGHVRPLSRVTFAPHEAPRAFRLLAASRHRGRVLLRTTDALAPAHSRIVCSSDSTHMVIWDGSSFGLQFADRLIACGATKLRIYCLHPPSQHLLKLRLWKRMGLDVEVLFGDKYLKNSSAVSETINDIIQCGPIEGIYVAGTGSISDGKLNNELIEIVAHLDTASRKLCPLLRYFAVITVGTNLGQQTCLSRYESGFPATALSIEKNTFDAFMDELSWNRSLVDVTQAAIWCRAPVLSAHPQAVEETSLMRLLSAVDENEGDFTLSDLGLGESLFSIKTLLRDAYHVTLGDEELLMLTKKKLLEIEKNSSEHKFEEIEGLHIYFSQKDFDELRATMDFILMETLVPHVEKLAGAIDASRTHMFIIPGLEGHHARFRTLCEHLKLPAFVLQPGLDHPNETPQELALRYSKVLLEKFKLKTTFYLLSYECGIFVVLELASILEDCGLTGTVFCIGDGPDETKALLEAEMSAYGSEEALQEGVVRHMFGLMAGGSSAPLERALRGCSSWRARVDACVPTLRGRVSHSAQYARALVEAAYARIGTARRYSAAPRALRSRLVLLRARRAPASTAGDECSLQRYSQRALVVRDLAAPMAHAAADLRAPAILNTYLDEHILQLFANSNLCEVYMY